MMIGPVFSSSTGMSRPVLILLIPLLAACSPAPQSSMTVAQPLDPEFYRQEIGMLDAAVFQDGRLDENRQMEVAVGLDQLMRNVRLDDEAPATADTLMHALGELYARVAGSDTSKKMEDSGIREEWIRIRSTYFADAGWFRDSPDDPVDDLRTAPPTDAAVAFQREGLRANTALYEALMKLMMLAGAEQKDLQVNKEEELRRLEELFRAPSPIENPHFHRVRSEGLEAIRYIRGWMATGHDTLPGSPGRALVDSIIAHYSAAQEALDQLSE
jgi:hypothetical protein